MKTVTYRTSGSWPATRTLQRKRRIAAVMAATAIALMSFGSGANAALLSNWFDSFESYASGSSLIGQGGWSQLNGSPPGSNQLVTVQSNPSMAIDGSQYLRIESLAPVAQSVTHIQNVEIGSDGTIQWFANAQQTLGSSLGVTLAGNLGGAVIAKVNFGCCGGFNYSSNTTSIASASYQSNVWYGFRVHMNGPSMTYNLNIFQASNNSNIVTAANIPYWTPTVISNFYFIGFNTDPANGVFFVDKISAIPEPSAVSLLGVAGLAAMLRRRRRTSCSLV